VPRRMPGASYIPVCTPMNGTMCLNTELKKTLCGVNSIVTVIYRN